MAAALKQSGTYPYWDYDSQHTNLRFCVPCDAWYDRSRGPHICPHLDRAPARAHRALVYLLLLGQLAWLALLAYAAYRLLAVAHGH